MLRGIVAFLEKHHNVRIFDEAVSAAGASFASIPGGSPVAG